MLLITRLRSSIATLPRNLRHFVKRRRRSNRFGCAALVELLAGSLLLVGLVTSDDFVTSVVLVKLYVLRHVASLTLSRSLRQNDERRRQDQGETSTSIDT